jgi:hypothetical protein
MRVVHPFALLFDAAPTDGPILRPQVLMALLAFAATLRIGMPTQRATTAVAVALALLDAVRAADVARHWRVRNRMSRRCAG